MNDRVRHMQSAAVFIVLQKDSQVLLLQRKATGWMDGQYSVPAGTLDPDETIKDAAIREVLEEIGVIVHPQDISYAHTMHCKTGAAVWMGHFFTTTNWQNGPKVCEPDKHSEVLWCDLGELPDNVIPYVKQALENISLGVSYSEFGWGG